MNAGYANQTTFQRHSDNAAGNAACAPLPQSRTKPGKVIRYASWNPVLIVLMVLLVAATSWGADYVTAVDVSGSMSSTIGRHDQRVRINVVQEGLRQYLPALPSGSRVDLIAFNSGIVSEEEVILRGETERGQVMAWIDGLEDQTRQNKQTHLWTTLRHAFKVASRYSLENPTEPVTVRVLTDGKDNEGVTTLDEVLQEFLPLLDGNKIRGNLVLLGDLEFKTKLSLPDGAFETSTNPEWEVLFPPIVLMIPSEPKTGDEVHLFENNTKSIYRDYEWQVDGTTVGREKVLTWRFTEPRSYGITLKVTGLKGTKTAASVLVKAKGRDRPPTSWPGWARSAVVGVACLLLLTAAANLIRQRRRKALRLPVHYWAERSLVCQTVVLTEADQVVGLKPAAPILIKRDGKTQNLVVQPVEGATLFDTNGEETPSRSVGEGVRVAVKPPNGPALAIAISIRQKPQRPTPVVFESEPRPESDVCGLQFSSGETSVPAANDEFDWGWDTTAGAKIG
jgi:von Willebrand factor type A domain